MKKFTLPEFCEMNLGFGNVMDRMTKEIPQSLAQQKDSEVHQLLTELREEYQPLEALAKRCRLLRKAGDNFMTLTFDGRAVMEIYDTEFSIKDGKAVATFKTRRL